MFNGFAEFDWGLEFGLDVMGLMLLRQAAWEHGPPKKGDIFILPQRHDA